MQKYIYWFRRDLRLYDNIAILKCTAPTLFVFCFTPEQTVNNKLSNITALNFIFESLVDLEKELKKYKHKLHIFYAHPHVLFDYLCRQFKFTMVIAGMDYSPYSIQRDNKVSATLDKIGVKFTLIENNMLLNVNTIVSATGTNYVKFTPFYDKAMTYNIPKCKQLCLPNISVITVPCSTLAEQRTKLIHRSWRKHPSTISGGRVAALDLMASIKGNKHNDAVASNITQLSAYINRGCVSPREVYVFFNKLRGKSHDMSFGDDKMRQLWWREFYINLVYNNPSILSHDVTLRVAPKFSKLWNVKLTNRQDVLLKKWCAGQTGYPMIDSSMQEMNETGYMHNRGRMMCAEFLVKRLFIHWQFGERYFVTKLIDYDAIQNSCNWIWVACVQPYFRAFNPEHGESHYVAHIADRLASNTHKPIKKIPILTTEEIVKRYERMW